MRLASPLPAVMLGLLCGLVLMSSPPARADDTPIALGISPAISEITIARGQHLERQLTVDNKTPTPIVVRIYAENFEASDPYGGVSFNTDDTKQYSARAWLAFSKPSLILSPGERQTLTITITCPPDAEPGGHYASVFFEPIAAATTKSTSNLGITQRVGALLFVTVAGNNTEQGQVLGAQTAHGCSGLKCSFKTAALREWGPVPFAFSFQNTGNVHVKVAGIIKITNAFGRTSGQVTMDEKTVLPGSSRAFAVTWPREVLLGRYTAKLALTYGQLRRTDTASVTFWVIPWRVLLGLLGVGLAGGGIVWFWRRRRQIGSIKP